MSNYYSVSINISFGILADSQEDAKCVLEVLQQGIVDESHLLSSAIVTSSVYLTPNQSSFLKRLAVNYE